MTDEPLVSTRIAASHVGVSARTLQLWTSRGLVTPTRVLPSGHARWLVSDLEEQMARLAPSRR